MSIKREDLRVRYGPTEAPVRMNRDGQYEIDVPPQGHRTATDADLAALGYVRLDVVAEELRYQLSPELVRQVLAALDREEA